MGNYYALELFSGDKRQIFFSEKGLPPSEFLTVFRTCDRAYPSFPSGVEDSDDRYIPSHAYVVSVAKLTERLEVMGFTLQRLEENVKRCLKADRTELDHRIEYYEHEGTSMPSYYRKLKRQRRTLEQFTLRRWVNSMRDFRTRESLSPFLVPKSSRKEFTSLQRHMLNADEEYDWYYFGLPVSDLRYLLRAVLLCADADENVFLDLTEVEGDYFAEGDEPVQEALADDLIPGIRPKGSMISDERKGNGDVEENAEHRADHRCVEATGSGPDCGGDGARSGCFQAHHLRLEVAVRRHGSERSRGTACAAR